MEDNNFPVNVDLANSRRIQQKFLGTLKGKKLIFLTLALRITQPSPPFALQSCFKPCSYIHSKASRGLSCYIRKIHYTRDCFIFLNCLER